jgi:hypothetical protein
MHCIGFVMIDTETDTDIGILRALAPFDEDHEVLPYRIHLSRADVHRMAAHYGIAAADLHGLSEKMGDWTRRAGGVDAEGLYYLATHNPAGRWDWYEVGGRWDGYLHGTNVMPAGRLSQDKCLRKHLPFFLLNPAGEWIAREQLYVVGPGVRGVQVDRMTDAAWLRRVREQLERWPEHQVVCVDVHY